MEALETIVRALGLHILPGQQLEDRVPCGMTLRRAMDDICHQAHEHQSGMCAQAGAGAIGLIARGTNWASSCRGGLSHVASKLRQPDARCEPPRYRT
ncbi:hypothetical protein HaLaN_28795 [Haematococcus lacustris]|uniref:Uncharacterized protein n=1 Tax=Haematococcus lacustris TaxID=44745 RepID=A0A6A0ABA9_HAELA|nr:hypothetical protein HaLaN_28795 [Haematococcus lacustris]